MATWINHVTIAAPRNGTTTHTVDPSTGTVVTGTLFTPTAGNLLVCVAEGSVTSSTPSGWTLPAGGSAINFTGLYVWYRTAAGGDTFSTTHNGSNYPMAFDIYEYASGSTFVSSAAATAVANSSSAGPTISGLSGTNMIMGALGHGGVFGSNFGSVAWGSGTEVVDTYVTEGGTGSDGYLLSLAYLQDSVLTSTSMSTTVTVEGSGSSNERLIFAVNAVDAGGVAPISYVGQGTVNGASGAAQTVTTINPTVHASATTGDLSVLSVAIKPYSATISSAGVLATWTKIGEATNGTTANSAADLGSTKVAVFVKESAATGGVGVITFGSSPNTITAVVNTYRKDATGTWDYSQFTTGGDTTNGANYSATGADGIAVAATDWVVASTAVNGDVGTQSAQDIGGMAGATMGATNVRTSFDVTTGNDSHIEVVDETCTAGSSSAAPTFTYTNASSGSGTTLWLRLRQTFPSATVSPWRQSRTAIRRAANW